MLTAFDDKMRNSQRGDDERNAGQLKGFVIFHVENDHFAGNSDQSHFHNHFHVNSVLDEVRLDRGQQFDPDQYQQKKSKQFQQSREIEQNLGGLRMLRAGMRQ